MSPLDSVKGEMIFFAFQIEVSIKKFHNGDPKKSNAGICFPVYYRR